MIADTNKAEQALDAISYFRLADYWYHLEANHHTHQFLPDSHFDENHLNSHKKCLASFFRCEAFFPFIRRTFGVEYLAGWQSRLQLVLQCVF
jgi:hypothetical protein